MDLANKMRPSTVVEMYKSTEIIQSLPALIENTVAGKTPGLAHRMIFSAQVHVLWKTTLPDV